MLARYAAAVLKAPIKNSPGTSICEVKGLPAVLDFTDKAGS